MKSPVGWEYCCPLGKEMLTEGDMLGTRCVMV